MRRWKLRISLPLDASRLGALCLIALATVLRLMLIPTWPVLNSDEGTMGVMALHIVAQGKLPVFFYGQGYMGSLEALLAAPIFRLFGPSVFALRLGLVLLYAFFLVNMYLLTSLLYTRRLALVVLLVLSFGSNVLLALQLSAIGGYPEMLFFGSLLLLYALRLARSAGEVPLERRRRLRLLAYAGWGLVAGVALWIDLLLLPYVCCSGWIIWRFCRREMNRTVVLSMVCSFLLALLPTMIYNTTVPLDRSTLAFFGAAYWVKESTPDFAPPLIRIAGTLFVALPGATGGTGLCTVPLASVWPLFNEPHAAAACTISSGLWGTGFLLLILLPATRAYRASRALRQAEQRHGWLPEEKALAAGYAAQVALVGSALLLLLVYASTSPAGLDPVSSTRYLTSTLIALPVALWPIWRAGTSLRRKRGITRSKTLGVALLFVIVFSFVLGWVHTLSLLPEAHNAERQEADLIHNLLSRGITHIYTDYWTCDRIAFESQERIICSVVDEQLHLGVNRVPSYTALVTADPTASWVFPVGSPQDQTFQQQMKKSRRIVLSFTRDGYRISMPRPALAIGQYRFVLVSDQERDHGAILPMSTLHRR